MRLKVTAVVAICVFGLTLLASAGQNKFGIADNRTITFADPTRVGDVLLPTGDYQVKHTMDGQNHIMVFRQLHTGKPAEARVKCQLVDLKSKAKHTEQIYVLNAANERVLHILVFEGDTAQHVF